MTTFDKLNSTHDDSATMVPKIKEDQRNFEMAEWTY
jgi:hypothetical protein